MASKGALEVADCNGCAVCALSCPVWRQSHDQFLTFSGRMRALQGGASAADVSASLNACVLCGSCEPVCSYGMDSVTKTIDMLATLTADNPGTTSAQLPVAAGAQGKVLLLNSLAAANAALKEQALRALGSGFTEYADNGEDISLALEGGGPVDSGRVTAFISRIGGAAEIITTDGMIYRLIRRLLPKVAMLGLGEALMQRPAFRRQLRNDDLYVIDTRTYHADFKRLVVFYDELRKETDCMMNLDLHRVATPTGASLLRREGGVVDPVVQAEWIVKGRKAARIIVEKVEDMAPLKKASGLPVIFVGELA